MTIAEWISEHTWSLLQQSRQYDVRLGEVTLTDILALELVKHIPSSIMRLYKSNQSYESKHGADLEIMIRYDENRAIILTVQCKKLDYTDRYDNLNHKVGPTRTPQIDLLEKHAKTIGSVPFYLLYNYVPFLGSQGCWHCCQGFDLCQFGCTFVPSWLIRRAINQRGSRNFQAIHTNKGSLPWRCTFDCPNGKPNRLLDDCKTSLKSLTHLTPSSRIVEQYDGIDFDPIESMWPNWLWNRYEITTDSEWSSKRNIGRYNKTRKHGDFMRNINGNLLDLDDILELYRPITKRKDLGFDDEPEQSLKTIMMPRWILLFDPNE